MNHITVAPNSNWICEKRYRRVTDAWPAHPINAWDVTDTPRMWFMKLEGEWGEAPEAFAEARVCPDTCSICLALKLRRASKRCRGAWEAESGKREFERALWLEGVARDVRAEERVPDGGL